jgi:hypothetical protein
MSCDNVVDAKEVLEKASSEFPLQKVYFIADELAHGEAELVTLVAVVQTMGIVCPVDLHIEEEDEIDNHELSLGARFLMGWCLAVCFMDLCLGYFWHLAAKGFCCRNSMSTLWHHCGRSLASGNQSWRCQTASRPYGRIVVVLVPPTQL